MNTSNGADPDMKRKRTPGAKTRVFEVRISQDDDGWLVGNVKGLPGVHTQARTLAQLEKRILEAIALYQETEEGAARKAPASHEPRPRMEGVLRLEVAA